MAVNRTIDVPLYAQIREALREDLARMEPGQAIPPEGDLQARFEVSRITVRKAIDDLVTDGLLVRQQGRGTFVQRPKLTHELNMITSWTEQLLDAGFTFRTMHLETEEIAPPKRIATSLELGPEEQVFALRRLRMVSEEPMTLMLNYVPSRLVPGIGEKMAGYESLYEVLEKHYGLIAARAVDVVETRTATDEEARRLRIENWAPLLCVTRVSYLEDGRPLEFGLAISRGDRYRYRVELRGRARIDPAERTGPH